MSKNNFPADERQAFNDLLERVEHLETDKDRFLKAARLSRHERPPMSDSKFESLLVLIGICTVVVTVALVIIIPHVF